MPAGPQVKDETFDALFVSPLTRARQTADIVARDTGLATRTLPALREVDLYSFQAGAQRSGMPDVNPCAVPASLDLPAPNQSPCHPPPLPNTPGPNKSGRQGAFWRGVCCMAAGACRV